MSGTDIAHGTAAVIVRYFLALQVCYQPTHCLRDVRVWRYAGTDGAICLRSCYAVSGTDTAYAATAGSEQPLEIRPHLPPPFVCAGCCHFRHRFQRFCTGVPTALRHVRS
eukprot:2190311-Rhodomonas_salina.3